MIAESPPVSSDEELRFFYNPDQEKYDFLFKAIMEVIFHDFKSSYRKGEKSIYLERFEDKGLYLIDATDRVINNLPPKKREQIILSQIEDTLREIGELISKETPIFLIKKDVFKIFYPRLKKLGYNIAHDDFLPFPSNGHQTKFKSMFRNYFEEVCVPKTG